MDAQTAILIGAPFAVGLASLGPAIGIGYLTGQYFNIDFHMRSLFYDDFTEVFDIQW